MINLSIETKSFNYFKQNKGFQYRIRTATKMRYDGLSLSPRLGSIYDALERRDAVPDFEVPDVKEWLKFAEDRIFEKFPV